MSESKEEVLRVIGVSYRTASIETRECFAQFAAETQTRLPSSGRRELEMVVLSTCNRTEIYTWGSKHDDYTDALDRRFRELAASLSVEPVSADSLYQLRNASAARHLLEVACGLDSAILGDLQILSQIKQARLTAGKARGLGPHLERLFQIAVRIGRRARRQTEIGYGSASVGSALVSTIRSRSKSDAFRILLIGAGDAARNIGQHLAKSKLGPIVCINRTARRAEELAHLLEGESRPWEDLHSVSLESDLIVAATSAPEPVLRKNHLNELAERGRHDPVLIVDAGVPRNVEPGSSATVIDIDQVRERQEEVMARRSASVPSVARIVEDALEEWARWQAARPMEAIVKSLFQELPGYTKRTASRLVEGDVLTSEKAERVLAQSVQRLLHDHVRRLRTLVVSEPG